MHAATSTVPSDPRRGSAKPLQAIGATGAAMALVILCASVVLRLSTRFDANGAPFSTLPSAVEDAVRLTHRLTASSVGLLAIAALVLAWLRRASLPRAMWPTAGIVVATTLLAVIGPLTPGYHYAWVTVANVVGGTVLLMSCWWLREAMAQGSRQAPSRHPWLVAALAMFLVHIGSGALASALEMRGLHWVAYVHIGTAILFLIAAGEVVSERSSQQPFSPLVRRLTALLAVQIVLGLLMLWLGRQTVWLGLPHALVSQLLAAGLVSVALRRSTGTT